MTYDQDMPTAPKAHAITVMVDALSRRTCGTCGEPIHQPRKGRNGGGRWAHMPASPHRFYVAHEGITAERSPDGEACPPVTIG